MTSNGRVHDLAEKAQNRIQDPAKLRRLIVELIGREDWSAMAADVKGDAYEGLLEKNAQDVKGRSALGQMEELLADLEERAGQVD